MPRRNFLARFAYDGSDFQGWQRLPDGRRTVQAEIEKALAPIVSGQQGTALAGPPFEIAGASRTDAGVHAEGQAASFHAHCTLSPGQIVTELNSALPPDIACLSCAEVDPRFHARYRARGKLYRYRIHAASLPDPFARRYSLHVDGPLDHEAMRAAAALFVGSHDFGAFTNGEGDPGGRSVESFHIEENSPFIDLLVSGPAFLYNQVRIMSAAVLAAGQGRLSPDCISGALREGAAARSRMPGALGPYGLCLVRVFYGEEGQS